MVEMQAQMTSGSQTGEPRGRSRTGEESRKRLLADMPVTERRLDLAGISTAVLEGGGGSPVVLLHGPSGYAAHWMGVIPGLAATHRVIAPDLPGHGSSEVTGGVLDADRVLAWLGELIDRTCNSPPVLVGQLLGGAIAARFASDHGHRLRRLVLVDTFGLRAFQPAPEFGLALTQFLAQPTEDAHRRLWRHCAFDLDGLRQRMGARWEPFETYNLDRARTPSVQGAVAALMGQIGIPAIPADDLARIAVPTTLIWGRHDRATPLAVAEAASARFGWPLQVIENCADDPPVERPEALLEAIRAAFGDALSAGVKESGTAPHEQTRAAWNNLAPGYDKTVTPTHLWLGNEGLRRAGLRPGMRFLDVAAGSGALSIPAARLGAEVLATDLSPVMLDLLEQRARQEGLALKTRVMDGHALDLADNSFDMAGSQFGVMLFPDMPKGISEMARVVKPGGRVLMNVYGDPRKIEFFGFFMRAIRSVRPDFTGPPMDPPPLPFQLQNPDRLHRELSVAGLNGVTVETITEALEFQAGKDLWDWLVRSNPIVEMVLGELNLTSSDRDAIRLALETFVRERAGGVGSAVLTNPINIGTGTK
jgi:pimeloyl-ACP methyl ester carboxylesterase/ubiquinone/menaquinone biosynthesis C-methylase UbiE